MNLATKITLMRILLIFPAAILYILGVIYTSIQLELLIACCVTFSILCATDFVDGTIARKTHTVTNLGKFLDPLADKVVVVFMLFLMMWKAKDILDASFPFASLVFSIASAFVVGRELIIGIFRTIAVQKGVVLAADKLGKTKTIFLDVAVAVLILAPLGPFFYWAGQAIFYVGAVLAIISGINYILKNKFIFSEIKEEFDTLKKSNYDIKADDLPPKFFDVLRYGVDGNYLSVEKIKKQFKIGSITIGKIFAKIEEMGYLGEETSEGRPVTLDSEGFDKLLLSYRGE